MQEIEKINSVMQLTFLDCDGVASTRTFSVDTWIHALDEFVAFLKGCGYYLQEDSVGINVNNHPCVSYHDVHRITTFE
jgi:hypothetical protein